MQLLLGLGIGTDTSTDDRLNLQADPYRVMDGSFRVEEDAGDSRYVYVTCGLHIKGTTQNALLNARNAIIDKLNQSTIGGTAIQGWVTLGVKLDDATTMVWWHVIGGTISAPGALRPSGSYIGHVGEPFQVTFRCHRGAFSEPIVENAVEVTGANPTLYRAGVPGTLPAYVEAVITDTSTEGVVLHGIGIGSRSAKDMDSAHFAPFQTVTATGPGSLVDEVPDSFGADYVSVVPGVTWSTFCYVQPSEAQMKGRYDLWVRLRDNLPIPDMPTGVGATIVTGANMRQQRTGGTSGTTATLAGYDITLPGSTLFLDVYASGISTSPSVSAVPTGFTLVESESHSNMHISSYVYPDAPSMSANLEVTLVDNANALVVLEEWTGLTATPTDVSASNTVTSATSHPTGTTAMTAQAATLLRTTHITSTSTPSGRFDDYTAGFIRSFAGQLKHGSTGRRIVGYYRVIAATGTQSATGTSNGSVNSANMIAAYKMTAGGALSAGTYHYRIASIDSLGQVSRATTAVVVYHPIANSATQLEWQAALAPGVTAYRVFIRPGTGTWVYFDTPNTTPAFLHTTMTSPTGTADPPDYGISPVQVRVGFALGASGHMLHTTATVYPNRSNEIWEWLRVSTEDVPPVSRPPGVTQPAYRAVVQARGGTITESLDVDVMAFVPGDEAYFDMQASEPSNHRRQWVGGTNPNGERFAWVRDPADATDVSGAISSGAFAIGPGDTKLLFLFREANGQSVVDNVTANVQLTLYPRWDWLAGTL